MEKNIVILGGGTAGLLTSIFVKKILPQYNVLVVRSKEIGIVGVGEATTPHFVTTLKNLNIDIFECIRKTNASIKNGIKFVNWNGDGKSYFHSFHEWLVDWQVPNLFGSECRDFYLKDLINKKLDASEYNYVEYISKWNRIDLNYTAWSLHFDAGLMAKFLEETAESRDISILDEIYKECETDENGNIVKLKFESGSDVKCSFVFDCSGFHRNIIGNHFKEKWVSYEKYLPMNKAIPFWLENEHDIEPFTTSTAMKNGWMWKIPLTSRIGCGYIFNSNYINVDEAKQEVEEYLQRPIDIRKVLNFDPGRFENLWVKNCMAIGLASSFLEPIESTSLWVTVSQLNLFVHFLDDLDNPNITSQKVFNQQMAKSIDECMYFVYLHYITKRQDSKFWQEFKLKNPIPNELHNRLELLIDNKLRYCDIGNGLPTYFSLSSYLQCAYGLGIIKNHNGFNNSIQPSAEDYRKIILENFDTKSYPNVVFLNDVNRNIPNFSETHSIESEYQVL